MGTGTSDASLNDGTNTGTGECGEPPVVDPTVPLALYWNKRVCELANIKLDSIIPEEAERHRIYSLLLMKIVLAFWNGNKRGQDGEYPWRKSQRRPNGTYAGDRYGDRYLGHNIACIGVDGRGEIIDFDFNHNDILSSSAEHAESRLVRRVFSLTQIYNNWKVRDPNLPENEYTNVLSQVTVYTSLESCAQCAGMMALGTVNKVVYLQHDPGMYVIGNILHNLTTPGLKAPLPVPGAAFGLSYYDELNRGFVRFHDEVGTTPFFVPTDPKQPPDKSQSITSFLCTDMALDIFRRAGKDFDGLKLSAPNYALPPPPGSTSTLTNQEVLDHAIGFYAYVAARGRRGTPHKL
jgi:tRNA(Arg) A34 adenosine deaminase TadA